jgi:hypothetical protein
MVLVVPDWGFYNLNPVTWLPPTEAETETGADDGANDDDADDVAVDDDAGSGDDGDAKETKKKN